MHTETTVPVGKTPERRYLSWEDHRTQMSTWAAEAREKHAVLLP